MSQNFIIEQEINSILRKLSVITISTTYNAALVNDVYIKCFICLSAKRGDIGALRAIHADLQLNHREQIMIFIYSM